MSPLPIYVLAFMVLCPSHNCVQKACLPHRPACYNVSTHRLPRFRSVAIWLVCLCSCLVLLSHHPTLHFTCCFNPCYLSSSDIFSCFYAWFLFASVVPPTSALVCIPHHPADQKFSQPPLSLFGSMLLCCSSDTFSALLLLCASFQLIRSPSFRVFVLLCTVKLVKPFATAPRFCAFLLLSQGPNTLHCTCC